jgi:hypothetical protein
VLVFGSGLANQASKQWSVRLVQLTSAAASSSALSSASAKAAGPASLMAPVLQSSWGPGVETMCAYACAVVSSHSCITHTLYCFPRAQSVPVYSTEFALTSIVSSPRMALDVYVCVFALVHRRRWSDLAKQLTTPLGTLAVLLAAFSFFVLGVETVDSNSLPRPRVRGQSHQPPAPHHHHTQHSQPQSPPHTRRILRHRPPTNLCPYRA